MSAHVVWSEQDDRRLIAMTKQALPVAVIADRLGRSYSATIARRMLLKRVGRIERLGYADHLEWTPDEESILEELIERGYSMEACGSQLGRSANSVKIKAKRLGMRLRTDRRSLTCRDVARIMGIGCGKTIVGWVERGWLTPVQQDRPVKGNWRFDEHALWDFVTIGDAHMTWSPDRITDPELRAYAREIRATAPRWLCPSEVAKRLGVSLGAVNDWIHKGLLTGVKYPNWWIREDVLAGFVVPCSISKQRVHRGLYFGCCDRRVPLGHPAATMRKRDRVCDRCAARSAL